MPGHNLGARDGTAIATPPLDRALDICLLSPRTILGGAQCGDADETEVSAIQAGYRYYRAWGAGFIRGGT